MLKIVINVQGDNEQSESELATLIGVGLIRRGYTNLAVIAHCQIVEINSKDRVSAGLQSRETGALGKDSGLGTNHPIITVTRAWH